MQTFIQFRPLAFNKFLVLMNRISSQIYNRIAAVLFHEIKQLRFDCRRRLTGSILSHQTIVRCFVFLPEFTDHSLGNNLIRNLYDASISRNFLKISTRNNRCDLKNSIVHRRQPRHFEVDPEQHRFFFFASHYFLISSFRSLITR